MNTTNIEIIHIKPYDTEMLGKFMNLDNEAVEKRIQLGYLDAKKAFSELLGNIYYFLPEIFREMVKKYGPDTMVNLEKLAYYLSVAPCKIYTENEFIKAVKAAYEKEQKRLQEEADAAEEKAKEMEEIFLADLKYCTKITRNSYAGRSMKIRLKEQVSRLLSPVL